MSTRHFFALADRKILPGYQSFTGFTHLVRLFGRPTSTLLMLAFGLTQLGSASWIKPSQDEQLLDLPQANHCQLYAPAAKGQFTATKLRCATSGSITASQQTSASGTPHFQFGSHSELPASPTGYLATTAFQEIEHEDAEAIDWLTGETFSRKLDDIQSVQWERATLGQILAEAQRTHELRIWIDRRVDTSQMVTMKLTGTSVGQSFSTLAQRCQSEVVFMPPLVVIVPQGTASRFLALRANLGHQAQQLPAKQRTLFRTPEPTVWQTFQQPNNLLRQWIEPISTSLGQLDSLPHDVWSSGSLPPLSLTDRLLLLSFGFDKHFQIEWVDGETLLKLNEISGDQSIDCLVEDSNWISSLRGSQTRWSNSFPNVQFKTARNTATLSGTLDDVANVIKEALQPRTAASTTRDLANQRFTLTVSQQVAGNILKTIADQTQLTMQMDAGSREALQKRIDIAAKDLTLQQLLNQVADATNTDIKVSGQNLLIRSK